MTWCLVSLLEAVEITLESRYDGSSRTAILGSSFDFSWNYTGDVVRVEWGTKDKDKNDLDVTILVLNEKGNSTPNVPQYNGRRFGNWNRQSPGQVKFTLNPIKVADNQVFIFKFFPSDPLASEVFDVVQLIVKGKNFYYVINCCFIMEGSMEFWKGKVMPLNFNNSERN